MKFNEREIDETFPKLRIVSRLSNKITGKTPIVFIFSAKNKRHVFVKIIHVPKTVFNEEIFDNANTRIISTGSLA